MQRHSREHVRHQRERYIAKRRRQFERWLGEIDWGPFDENGRRIHAQRSAPRPLSVREAEYWDGRRLGLLAKWNGVCSCWMCRGPRYRQGRARMKAETRRMIEEVG